MKMQRHMILSLMQCVGIIIGVLSFFPFSAHASAVLLSDKRSEIHIGQQLQILEDVDRKWGFAELEQLPDDVWTNSSSTIPTFGFTKSRYWVRFTVQSEDREVLQRILELEYSHYDKVNIFLVSNGEVQSFAMGDLEPFQTRLVDYRNFLLPFSLEAGGSIDFFVSFETSGPLFFPINIWNPIDFAAQKTTADHVAGYYYGIFWR
ncbi:MAG: 7TM-DISM domain-containing protein [Oligoflexus sp.]